MNQFLQFVNGKKTYIIAALAAIYGVGIQENAWPHIPLIDAFLAAGGLASLRHGIDKTAAPMIALCALLLLPGCATTNGPTGPAIDQATADQLLHNGISDAVSAGVVAAVLAEPSSLNYISAAAVAVKGFASSGDLTPDAFVAAMSTLPVKELQTKEAKALSALLITKYRSNYQGLVKANIANAPKVALIIDALSEGLTDGVVAAQALQK